MDERILNGDHDESLVLIEKARDEMDAGKYESVIELFEESNRRKPNYKTCLSLGDCLTRVQ
jgi:hypothetical protein